MCRSTNHLELFYSTSIGLADRGGSVVIQFISEPGSVKITSHSLQDVMSRETHSELQVLTQMVFISCAGTTAIYILCHIECRERLSLTSHARTVGGEDKSDKEARVFKSSAQLHNGGHVVRLRYLRSALQ